MRMTSESFLVLSLSRTSYETDLLLRYNLGDISFIAVAGILVFFMVPGVGE